MISRQLSPALAISHHPPPSPFVHASDLEAIDAEQDDVIEQSNGLGHDPDPTLALTLTLTQENVIEQSKRVGHKKAKLREKVEECQQALEKEERQLEAKREQLAQQAASNPEEQKARLKAELEEATKTAQAAAEAARQHSASRAELQAASQSAQSELARAKDQKEQKRLLLARMNADSAKLACHLEGASRLADETIGPLLMEVDVLDPSHQGLVEEAIGPMQASAYIATGAEVQSELNRLITAEKWKVSVDRDAHGESRQPQAGAGAGAGAGA